ncbi:MAG: tRNA 2-thiouridine(34) synthase MnmA [Anaeromyxobacteraceae bacterium]
MAMSGGVDSSVAAALLRDAGHEVTGVFLCLGRAGDPDGDSRGCCSPQDAADARRVAVKLGIELFVLDAAAEFERIIDAFAAEYAAGRTPNPCVRCNRDVKLARLLRHAEALGFDGVATGHYARVVERDGSPAIARAAALGKDQSYVLFALPRAALGRLVLPLGELPGKGETRELARRLGLRVHDKPDSMEICFVEDGDHAQILAARAPRALTPGPIVDGAGRVLGRHEGYGRYTIGQRRGLGVASAGRLYVTAIDPLTATVRVGPREATLARWISVSDATWHRELPELFEAAVQIRSMPGAAPAAIRRVGADRFEVAFHEPVYAAAPGQAAVVYADGVVLGGGSIEKTR